MDDNKKFWERFAKLYAPIQERSNAHLFEVLPKYCKPYLSQDTRVLELACGSGQFTIPLCSYAGYWEATDFSPNMIREARKRVPASVRTNIQDATALTYDDGSFQVVLIANALHIMPEPEKAMMEIRRVLCEGGILLAPNFVYEGSFNRFRMWITTKAGFKTYHQWGQKDFVSFLEQSGFEVLEQVLLPADPIPEGFFAARKRA